MSKCNIVTMRKQQGKGAALFVIDPRSGSAKDEQMQHCHEGIRSSKCVWLGNSDRLCTVGFTRQSKRQIKVWDRRMMGGDAISSMDIDQSSSLLWPFFDDAR